MRCDCCPESPVGSECIGSCVEFLSSFRDRESLLLLVLDVLLRSQAIQNIPGELIEAAKIDGANRWQLLKSVILPMLMPTITICTFLTLTNGFKLFDQNLALTGGNPGKMSELLALNIYNTMYGTTGWQGVGQAKAVIFFIIVAIIALAQNKITTSKEVQD